MGSFATQSPGVFRLRRGCWIESFVGYLVSEVEAIESLPFSFFFCRPVKQFFCSV